jgi:hypothetical protein
MRPVRHNRHDRVCLVSHWREPEKEWEEGDVAVVPRETFGDPSPEEGLESSVQCSVFSVQCSVFSVQCSECRV